MSSDDSAAEHQMDRLIRPRSHLFTVRLWTEAVAGGREFRGSARDVTTGAYRGFRDWSDLIDFLVARMEEPQRGHRDSTTGETAWSSKLHP